MSSPNTPSYDRTLFRAWPFLAFVLPTMICWGFGDLEYYFLIALSWIIIPVAGLLSLIPYFIARKRGWRKVPGASLGPLILNWWSAIIIACTIPGKLTGGGRSSVLELITLDSMSRAWNNRILTVTLIIGAASWLLLVVTTAMAGTATPTSRLQSRIGSVVAITAPCLAVIAAFFGGSVENSRYDGAGEHPEPALTRTIHEQLDLLAKREEVTQASLSEVRQLIAEDGWKGAYPWMFGSCDNKAHSCYDIYVTATVNTADADREVDATLIDELRENGWRSAKKPPYCHGDNITSLAKRDGQRLCVQQDDDTISVSLISPHYWGSLFALRDAAGPGILIFEPKSRDQYATYRWNEWASSDL